MMNGDEKITGESAVVDLQKSGSSPAQDGETNGLADAMKKGPEPMMGSGNQHESEKNGGGTKEEKKEEEQEAPLVDKHARNRQNKKRRKPRSQRNRKRPRSELHSNDDLLEIESTVARLEMNGKPILEPGGYEQFIRVIHPYPYTFSTYAKRRWVGRPLLDVYQSEFGSYPEVSIRECVCECF